MSQTSLQLDFLDGSIAQLTLDQPGSKVNTLGQAIVGEVESAVAQLLTRTDLRGLIFRSGKPGNFIAGADLRELGGAKPDPEQTKKLVQRGLNVVATLEKLPFPTIALIDGACVGGGLELALGFDYRLASTNPKTEIGLPETKIGLIPGWGGTQRLSRLLGPSLAAELICAGETPNGPKAKALGIVFDLVPADQLLSEAKWLLQWANEDGGWREARKRKQQPVGLSEGQLTFAMTVARAQVLAKTEGNYPAPVAAVDVIAKGCNLTLDEGINIETAAFVPLVGSPVSRNLIATFFLTQRLAKDTGVSDPSVQPRTVQQVGVVGAGLMGAGIAGRIFVAACRH